MNLNTNMTARMSLWSAGTSLKAGLFARWRWLLGLYLLACVTWCVAATAHWKQVNDPIQLHYVCYLIDHGFAPYRDLLEINMPGTYLMNWTVIHTLGPGSVAWRLFDFGLMGISAWAMIAIARPYDWLAGALGATLFILYHGRDGAGQMGQRDLVVAVLLLCACALLFRVFRSGRLWPMVPFGLCFGVSVTIKPLPLPFFLLLLGSAGVRLRQRGRPVLRPLLYAMAGFFIPIAVVIAWLASKQALGPFWYLLHVELPFYQHLGRLPWMKMLQLTMSDALKTLTLLALILAVRTREFWNWEMKVLCAGVLFGVFSFLGQGKGFPYHRYSLLAFLFLWAALQFLAFLRSPGPDGWLARGGLGFALVLLPICALVARHREWAPEYERSLTRDLTHLGGPRLSGHVQCFDVPADCDATLYRMQLVQSTGLFYDFLIFGPATQPVMLEQRARFWQQLQQNRPLVLVVGRGLFPHEDGYEKLSTWPLLEQEIANHYTLVADRTFPRAEPGQRAYRIYVDNDYESRVASGGL